MDYHSIQGGVEILLVASCLETGISSGLMSHLTRMQTSPYVPSLDIVGNLMQGKIQNTHVTECDSTGKIIPNLM